MIDTDIFWIILAAVVALIVALFTIRVRVDLELTDELRLSVLAFGARRQLLPEKTKKYNIRRYTLKKIARRDKRAARKAAKRAGARSTWLSARGLKKEQRARLTRRERRARRRESLPPIPKMISLFFDVLGAFCSRFLGKLHLKVVRINIAVGASDTARAAVLYGAICSAMKPILDFLGKYSNLHNMKNAEIDIYPDFLSDSVKADVKISFSMSIVALIGVLARAALKLAFGWIDIDPTSSVGNLTKSSPEKSAGRNSNTEKVGSTQKE